jgi:hypothetical protein
VLILPRRESVHEYSIDRSPKVRILFWLSAAAIFVAPLINHLLSEASDWLRSLGIFERSLFVAIPTFLIFLILYQAFNRWLWKCRPIRQWLLVPDLNGTWKCEGRSTIRRGTSVSHDWLARIEIVQSWSQMSIRLTTSQSSSRSVSASVRKSPHGFRLTYTYRNDPRPGEDELAIHDGIVELDLDLSHKTGQGTYFTDQHRQTSGSMRWIKE